MQIILIFRLLKLSYINIFIAQPITFFICGNHLYSLDQEKMHYSFPIKTKGIIFSFNNFLLSNRDLRNKLKELIDG